MRVTKWFTMGALLWMATAANAQPADAWQDLSQLRKGQKIEIVDMSLKKVHGEFSDFSEAALTIRTGADSVTLLREDVFRVSLREKSKRWRNAAIGAAIGAAAGLALGAAIDSSFSESGEHIAKTILTPVGAGAGAGIGSAFASFETVYRAPRRKKP